MLLFCCSASTYTASQYMFRQSFSFMIFDRHVSLTSTTHPHPLNVKPSGNRLLAPPSARLRELMGFLFLPDEILMAILSHLGPDDLRNISHTSRVLYAYAYDEELWKKLYMEGSERAWRGSWRQTVLGTNSANIQLPNDLVCSDMLYRPFQCSQIDYPRLFHRVIAEEERWHHDAMNGIERELLPGRIARIHENAMDSAAFDSLHDTPFILVNKEGRWPQWDLPCLLDRFPDVRFRQEAVQWTLSEYAAYLAQNSDESPLYLFDCRSDAMRVLRHEYTVPAVFKQDFFTVFGLDDVSCRPDHAWLIVGSSRSGSTFHKDPNHTSAWNAALTGRKLWIMLPPDVVPPGVGTNEDESEVTSPVGIAEWVLSGFYNDCLKIPEAKIAVTFPGECMYVPSGWWHSVINLDDSVALTQNFVPRAKLPHALDFLKNKAAQASGFKPREVREVIRELERKNERENEKEILGNGRNGSNTTNSETKPNGHANDTSVSLPESLSEYASVDLDANVGDEDCGELTSLPPMPLFDLFKHLMVYHGNKEELDAALDTLARIEKRRAEPARSKVWENLTGTSGFSFGFAESDED